MTKQEQIDEIAKHGCYDGCASGLRKFCDEYDGKPCKNMIRIAGGLYDHNCRIIPEDSVVLSKGAYESLSNKAKANVVNAVEIRKETAEQDFSTIINALEERKDRVKAFYGVAESVGVDITIRTVKELAKQFGVE